MADDLVGLDWHVTPSEDRRCGRFKEGQVANNDGHEGILPAESYTS
jgi:hypothetical protein